MLIEKAHGGFAEQPFQSNVNRSKWEMSNGKWSLVSTEEHFILWLSSEKWEVCLLVWFNGRN